MSIIQSLLLTWILWVSAEPVTFIDQRHISPICSTATTDVDFERVSLPNTHLVIAKNINGMPIYRSNSPYKTQHVLDILNLGIENVLIYKTFHDKDDKELLYSLYADSGFDTKKLKHIPMPWKRDGKKVFDFKGTCEMTVKAMDTLMKSPVASLFHCTVGEDRTGMLAGLLQVNNGMSIEKAFRDEMCARGYEAGNPRKSESPSVVNAVREVLTPLFLKMATVIASKGTITQKDCAELPDVYANELRAEDLVCEPVRVEMLCAVEKPVVEEELPFGLAPTVEILPFDF